MSIKLEIDRIRDGIRQAGSASGYMPDTDPVLRYAEEIDSTNEWAKRDVSGGASGPGQKDSGTENASSYLHSSAGFVVYLADHQTAGKGRRGRVWESPAGTSVSMSILMRPGTKPENFPMLTLVMGLAAAEGIRDVSGLDVRIKWPNDVVCGGRKLCGILTELCPDAVSVVIGIGLNINMTGFPEELDKTAVSIRMLTGSPVSREEVTAAVIARFRQFYQLFLETGDLKKLKSRYESLLVNLDAHVHVLDPRAPFDGTALGIDDRGELLVRRDDTGETVSVFAGEVSVRGIYGYV